MFGAREYIRNGQPHFITSQKVVNLHHKTRKPAYYLIPFTLLLVFTCAGFIGFLYYLDLKFNADIREYNDKVNIEIKSYADKVNVKVLKFEQEIQRLTAQIEDMQKKIDKKRTADSQDTLQESETNKFKAIALENVEEFPEIEGVEDGDLETDQHLVRQNHTGGLFDNFRPPNAHHKRHKTVEELGPNARDNKRHRRGAEITNVNGVNLIETSRESELRVKHDFDSSTTSTNQTETTSAKRSGLLNQNGSTKGLQNCCCVNPCEESVPRKASNSQKNANKRSLVTKKSQNIREESSSTSEMDDSTDTGDIRKTAIAAHFGADSSRYSIRTHTHYEGNGHLRHPTGEYEDWKPSPWFDELNMDKHFVLINGNIKVHSSGLYFVYAQIFYSDLSDVNGYAIFQNSQIVLQCITSTYSLTNVTMKSNTCFTGGVIKCNVGDKISVKTIDVNRKVMLESSRSFVGMFKIGEFQNVK